VARASSRDALGTVFFANSACYRCNWIRDRASVACASANRARLQGALASLEDLTKGKRSEELDVIRARLDEEQGTLAL